MTTFEYKLLIILSQGEQPTQALYDVSIDDSRVRKSLRLLIKRGWVKYTRSEKMTDGPGAPMKHYALTETGILVLKNHEEELEELR